jgi:hypothetical protein
MATTNLGMSDYLAQQQKDGKVFQNGQWVKGGATTTNNANPYTIQDVSSGKVSFADYTKAFQNANGQTYNPDVYASRAPAVNTVIPPAVNSQAAELAKWQDHVTKNNLTQEQAIQQFGQGAVTDAMSKGLKFGGNATTAAIPGLNEWQAHVNKTGLTQEQAISQFGQGAVTDALSKGLKFGGNTAAATTATTTTPAANLGLGGSTVTPATPTAPSAPAAPAAPAAQAQTMQGYERNPYLDQMAQGITSQMNDNWSRNIAPTLRSGAMAAGGFGGSRQGVVEANALNDMNRSLGQNLTNLYGQDFTADRQRALQKYQADQGFAMGNANLGLGYSGLNNQFNIASMGNDTTRRGQDQSFTLGQGNLALGNKNADNSYITQNRQIDNNYTTQNRQIDNAYAAQQQNFGLQNDQLNWNIYNGNFNNSLNAGQFGLNTMNTMNNLNNQGTANGTTMQNTPINYFNNTNGNTMAAAGTGQPNQVAAQGNPYMAGAGAGLATYGALQNMNFTNGGGIGVMGTVNQNNSNPYSITSGFGPGLRVTP